MSTNPFEPPKEVNEPPERKPTTWTMTWVELVVIAFIAGVVLTLLLYPAPQMAVSK